MKKRIALAAIAALAGGLLVAAPASAVVSAMPFGLTNATSITGNQTATVAGSQIAGAANYVSIDTATSGLNIQSGILEGYLNVTGSVFTTSGLVGATLNAAGTTAALNVANNAAVHVNVVTPAAGTITVKFVTREWVSGVATDTTQQTFTITVTAAPAAAAYNHSVVSGLTVSNGYLAADGTGFSPKGLVNQPAPVESFTVTQYASADTSTLATGLTKAVTVSLSGVGVMSSGANNNVTYLAFSATTGDPVDTVTISNDGRAGVATITISIDGVVAATRTVSFYGAAATFTATIDKANISVGDTAQVTVVAKDAAGILVPNALANHTADSATVGSIVSYTPGIETFTVTAAAKAAATVTVGNYLVDTKTVVANFVTAGVASVSLAADKATYGPGEKATFTVTAKNSDGVSAGDATYALTTGGSAALYGFPTTVAVKNGVGTFTAYMPVVQGPVVVTASLAGSTSGSVSVAVVDAAAVAQAAAIVALQTSVATLTTTVASLVASMTAQIKVINATMLKIQKALAALRLQVKKLK